MAPTTVNLDCDASPLMTFVQLLEGAIKSVKPRLDIPNLPDELVRVENDADSAGTGKMIVRLYPSDAFLRYGAALHYKNVFKL